MRPLLVLLLWAALYLPWLGSTELKGEEGRRILPARAMIQQDQYIVPYSEGKPYHRKPPLINWMIAASFQAHGGESEWAARLPSALSMLGLALTALLAGRAWQSSANSVSQHFPLLLAALLLISPGFLEKGRLAEIEAVYCVLFGMALLTWAAAWQRGASPWATWLPPAVFLGIGQLAKGPIYLPFFYSIVIITLWKAGRLRDLLRLPHLTALGLMFALPLPWVFAAKARMATITTKASAPAPDNVWWQQLTDRLAPAQWDAQSWALSPFETLASFLPFSLLAVCLWWRRSRHTQSTIPTRETALLTGLAYGVLWSGLAFALSPQPHARFQLPLLTPLVLLTLWLAAREPTPATEPSTFWHHASTIATLALLALTLLSGILPALPAYAAMRSALPWMLGALPFIWIIFIAARRLSSPLSLLLQLILLLSAGMFFYYTGGRLQRATYEDIRPPAQQILAAAGPGARFLGLRAGPQHFLFYLGPDTREADSVSEITPDITHIIMPEKKWEEPVTRRQLQARGFTTALITVKDRDEKTFVAVQRVQPKP